MTKKQLLDIDDAQILIDLIEIAKKRKFSKQETLELLEKVFPKNSSEEIEDESLEAKLKIVELRTANRCEFCHDDVLKVKREIKNSDGQLLGLYHNDCYCEFVSQNRNKNLDSRTDTVIRLIPEVCLLYAQAEYPNGTELKLSNGAKFRFENQMRGKDKILMNLETTSDYRFGDYYNTKGELVYAGGHLSDEVFVSLAYKVRKIHELQDKEFKDTTVLGQCKNWFKKTFGKRKEKVLVAVKHTLEGTDYRDKSYSSSDVQYAYNALKQAKKELLERLNKNIPRIDAEVKLKKAKN